MLTDCIAAEMDVKLIATAQKSGEKSGRSETSLGSFIGRADGATFTGSSRNIRWLTYCSAIAVIIVILHFLDKYW